MARDLLRARFVGRTEQLARLRRAYDAAADMPRCVVLTGMGGVGKTTLARRFCADRSDPAGRVVWVSADEVAPTADAVAAAIARGGSPLEQLGRGPHRDVLVLDGFDKLGLLEGWLFDTALPSAGRHLLVLLASRERLDPKIRLRPDVQPLLEEIRLENLTAAESAAQLAHAGVPAELHAEMHELSHGHALTLALLAERCADGAPLPRSLHDAPDILGSLVHALRREAPTPEHVEALHALAIAAVLDKELLSAAVPAGDSASLFAWLAERVFVTGTRRGLIAHALVRKVLTEDLRRTSPEQHASIAERIAPVLVARLHSAADHNSRLRVSQQALVTRVLLPPEWIDPPWLERVELRRATREDVPVVAGMIERFEGPSARATFEVATEHYLDQLHLVVDGEAEPAGVLFPLRVRTLEPSLRARDPLLAAAHRWLLAREGEDGREAVVYRWFFGRSYQAFGREMFCVMTLGPMAMSYEGAPRYVICQMDEAERWVPYNEAYLMKREPEGDAWLDGRHYGASVFCLDVLGEGRENVGTRVLAEQIGEGASLARSTAEPPLVAEAAVGDGGEAQLDREAFESAWRRALPLLHRPLELRDNPVLQTKLVLRLRSPERPLEQAALEVVRSAVEQLATSKGYRRSAEILKVSFVEPLAKQEAAAAALGLPFGTYRYQLRKAVALLLEELWRREASSGDR